MDERGMIERALHREGMTAGEWRDGNDGLEAVLGQWRVTTDDERRGLYEGDEGELTCCVVGAEQYGNQRVVFSFTPEGQDGGEEVRPFEDLDPIQ